jgi:hypothetical protein
MASTRWSSSSPSAALPPSFPEAEAEAEVVAWREEDATGACFFGDPLTGADLPSGALVKRDALGRKGLLVGSGAAGWLLLRAAG